MANLRHFPLASRKGWFARDGNRRYLLATQGTPYVVGAGIYDPTTTIEDLAKLTGDQR